jgi:hypothetical protein
MMIGLCGAALAIAATQVFGAAVAAERERRQPQASVELPAKPAKPSTSTWAKQERLRSGKANLYDHSFETPKNRRR